MKRIKVSNNVIRRMPRYLRKLDDLNAAGIERISSGELGRQMGLTPSQIRQDFSCFGEDKDSDANYLSDCDLLIIDDLGTEVGNTYTNSKLFYVINERMLKKKSTIISTNLSLSEIRDSYSERIFSRITSSYTILKVFGSDIRMMKKTGRKPGKA